MKFWLKALIVCIFILNVCSLKLYETRKNNRRRISRLMHKKGFWDSIKNAASAVGSAVKSAAGAVGNAVKSAASAVGNAAKAVGSAVKDAAVAVGNAVKSAANKVIEEGKSMIKKLEKNILPDVNHGSGSWKEGYDCPNIKVGTTTENLQKEGRGTFYAEQLFKPDTPPEKLGWVFDMRKQAPGVNLKKIMIQFENTSFWYIPFSFFVGDFKYVNPVGLKYIEGKIKNLEKEQYVLRVELPWKATGWFISDEEGQKIAERLNQRQKQYLIISDNWKFVCTWTDKQVDLDLKVAIRKYGGVRIKSYRDGPTDWESVKWGTGDSISGGLVQSAEVVTTGYNHLDSVQFYVANYAFQTKSIIDSGATFSIFNGEKKIATLSVPKNGSKTFPYWYIGQLYRYGMIIENELDKQNVQKKRRFMFRIRRLRRVRRLFHQ